MAKEWSEIEAEYTAMEQMSCTPSVKRVNLNHVFDEDKSVKWNREQAEKNNQQHEEEVKRLNTEKNKRRDAVHEEIYQFIQEEVGHGLSRKKAMTLWDYAWQEGHAYGLREVKGHLDELMKLAEILLRKEF